MSNIDLSNISTKPPSGLKKQEVKKVTKTLSEKLHELHRVLYAERRHSMLVVMQGMDASGKNGGIRNVFNNCSPSIVRSVPFVRPTEKEMQHDFLWRIHKHVPAKGKIVIFNRSHYEDILVQKVHNWIDDDRRFIRMNAINHFEELLSKDNNTRIVKFYLHISKKKQKKELQERLDEQDKHWKHNVNDWKDREYWDDYREAYNYAINNSKIPWHIIPVDKRWYRNYLMTKIIVEELEALNMEYPDLPKNA
jgi:PPK2 family polyphosphate:nucleotide phosphotransferase